VTRRGDLRDRPQIVGKPLMEPYAGDWTARRAVAAVSSRDGSVRKEDAQFADRAGLGPVSEGLRASPRRWQSMAA